MSPGSVKNYQDWVSVALSPVVKRQVRETLHSFLASAEASSPYIFITQCLVNHREILPLLSLPCVKKYIQSTGNKVDGPIWKLICQ
jgi:hypothetical protein